MTLYAHRGASAHAPENTIPSFKKALEMGARGIELDVQLSADGIPVVIHDFFLNKTTEASGMVRSLEWKEISKLDAGSWFGNDFRGTGIPALEDVLALIPRDVCLNIEVKSISLFQEPTTRIVLDMLEQEGGRDILISSFNHNCLKEVRERDPEMKIGILTGSDMIDFTSYVKSTGLNPYSLHPEASYLTKEYVDKAHAEGWKVMCYTVNSPDAAELVGRCGVDGFFSDYPELIQ